MNQYPEDKKTNLRFFGTTGGVLLILCGVAALLFHRLDIDTYLVLVTSIGLLVVGSAVMRTTLIVAGCLLGGTGLGLLMYAGPWNIPAANQRALAIFCFAFGWFLIPVFTRLFTVKTRWLAFVPGSLMAILAGVVLSTNDRISWILQGLLLDRSISAPILATDLILIGFALIVPWKRMVKSQSHANTNRHPWNEMLFNRNLYIQKFKSADLWKGNPNDHTTL